jgi:UDP-N-acetylmuramoylalanine--D-glutamate ligase
VRWLVREGWSVKVADTREAPPGLAALRERMPQVEFTGTSFDPALLDGIELVAISPGLSPLQAPAKPLLDAARTRKI